MSTLTATRRSTNTEQPRLTFGTTMAAEWKKLFTVRSTVFAAAAMVVLSVAMVVLVAAVIDPAHTGFTNDAEMVGTTLTSGVSFSQLVMGVLAVLIVANEYSTGLIQSTLVAIPRRGYVFMSKLLVAAVLAVVLTLLSWLASAAVTLPVLGAKGITVSILTSEAVAGLATFACYMLIVALFGVFVATIVRSTAASVAIVVGVLFVLPIAGLLLPESFDLASYTLGGAAQTVTYAFTGWDVVQDHFAKALTVVLVWLGATGAAAITVFTRRDA